MRIGKGKSLRFGGVRIFAKDEIPVVLFLFFTVCNYYSILNRADRVLCFLRKYAKIL